MKVKVKLVLILVEVLVAAAAQSWSAHAPNATSAGAKYSLLLWTDRATATSKQMESKVKERT